LPDREHSVTTPTITCSIAIIAAAREGLTV